LSTKLSKRTGEKRVGQIKWHQTTLWMGTAVCSQSYKCKKTKFIGDVISHLKPQKFPVSLYL